MIVPPLPALFSIPIGARNAIFELVGDDIPPFGSELLDKYGYKNILFYKPLMSNLSSRVKIIIILLIIHLVFLFY